MIGGTALPTLMPRIAATISAGLSVMPACTSDAQNNKIAIDECATQVRMPNKSTASSSSLPSEEMIVRINRLSASAADTWLMKVSATRIMAMPSRMRPYCLSGESVSL